MWLSFHQNQLQTIEFSGKATKQDVGSYLGQSLVN